MAQQTSHIKPKRLGILYPCHSSNNTGHSTQGVTTSLGLLNPSSTVCPGNSDIQISYNMSHCFSSVSRNQPSIKLEPSPRVFARVFKLLSWKNAPKLKTKRTKNSPLSNTASQSPIITTLRVHMPSVRTPSSCCQLMLAVLELLGDIAPFFQ